MSRDRCGSGDLLGRVGWLPKRAQRVEEPNPSTGFFIVKSDRRRTDHSSFITHVGQVPEWPIGTVCKTVGLTPYGGSNPPLPTIFAFLLRKERNPAHPCGTIARRKNLRFFLLMERAQASDASIAQWQSASLLHPSERDLWRRSLDVS